MVTLADANSAEADSMIYNPKAKISLARKQKFQNHIGRNSEQIPSNIITAEQNPLVNFL